MIYNIIYNITFTNTDNDDNAVAVQCFARTLGFYLEIIDKFHTNNFQFVNKVNQTFHQK